MTDVSLIDPQKAHVSSIMWFFLEIVFILNLIVFTVFLGKVSCFSNWNSGRTSFRIIQEFLKNSDVCNFLKILTRKIEIEAGGNSTGIFQLSSESIYIFWSEFLEKNSCSR